MVEKFMGEAIKEALKARKKDEVPIGAVIVKDDKIIARAHNLVEKKELPTAHAEILAIEKACKKLKSRRLDGASIFITLEPCPMCAGAIVNARIKSVYFGAYEQKSGSAESKFDILTNSGLNHKTEFTGGIRRTECESLIKNYFKEKRAENTLTKKNIGVKI